MFYEMGCYNFVRWIFSWNEILWYKFIVSICILVNLVSGVLQCQSKKCVGYFFRGELAISVSKQHMLKTHAGKEVCKSKTKEVFI